MELKVKAALVNNALFLYNEMLSHNTSVTNKRTNG